MAGEGKRLLDLPSTDDWVSVSQETRALLPFPTDGLHVQVYAGFQHAMFEACRGLAKLFSHEKIVALVDGLEPALESIAVDFSEEAYDVRRLGAPERADFANWLTAAINETAFILFSEDDPVTGRLFDQSWLAPAKDKRVFRVSVSHASWRTIPLVRPLPFEVRVLSIREDLALLVAGERFRVVPTLAPRLPWSRAALDQVTLPAQPQDEATARISAFESALPKGFAAYFQAGEARVADRAVIYHPEIDGSAVLELLGLSDRGVADTTSQCRWQSPRFRDWLLARGESEEIVRGLLVFDAKLLTTDLPHRLEKAASELLALQNGS